METLVGQIPTLNSGTKSPHYRSFVELLQNCRLLLARRIIHSLAMRVTEIRHKCAHAAHIDVKYWTNPLIALHPLTAQKYLVYGFHGAQSLPDWHATYVNMTDVTAR